MGEERAVILADHYEEAELIEAFKKTKRTWDRWLLRGDVPPFVKIGRKRYYRKDAVAQWLRDREQSVRRSRGGAR